MTKTYIDEASATAATGAELAEANDGAIINGRLWTYRPADATAIADGVISANGGAGRFIREPLEYKRRSPTSAHYTGSGTIAAGHAALHAIVIGQTDAILDGKITVPGGEVIREYKEGHIYESAFSFDPDGSVIWIEIESAPDYTI